MEDVPVELCTHAIYAFAVLDADSLVAREHDAYLDKAAGLDNYRRFVTLRERNPQAKVSPRAQNGRFFSKPGIVS